MEKELLELVRELKLLVTPKKRNFVPESVPKPAQNRVEKAPIILPTQPLTLPKMRQEERKIEKKIVEALPAKVAHLPLEDLSEWYQKRFKTQLITPMSDKKAFDAKMRYKDGTKEAPVVLLIPKKLKEGKELYKAIQTAIHQYLIPCMVLAAEQLSKDILGQTRLLILDRDWIRSFEKELKHDLETQNTSLWGIPIFFLEPYETLKTPLGKKRLWKALLTLSPS